MLASRFFHPSELSVLEKEKSQACQSLAARFACKEAFGKALGTGFVQGISFVDVELFHDDLSGLIHHKLTTVKIIGERLCNFDFKYLINISETDYNR